MWASMLFTARSAAGMTPKVFCSALLRPRGNSHHGQGPLEVPPPLQHGGVLQSAQKPGTGRAVRSHPAACGTQNRTVWRDSGRSRLEIWEKGLWKELLLLSSLNHQMGMAKVRGIPGKHQIKSIKALYLPK